VGNSGRKSPLGRLKCRKNNKLKIDTKENEALEWTDMSLFMDRWLDLINALIYRRFSLAADNFSFS